MQATEADVTVDTGTMPETRPGLHVTQEGRLVGHAEVNVEWEGPTDDRTAGVTEIDGVPVMMTDKETHEDLRKDAGLPPNGVDGSPGAPGVPPQHPNERHGGPGAGAAAPAVTTTVTNEGKRTMEHEFSGSMELEVDGETAAKLKRLLGGTADEAMERAKRRGKGGRQ